jgi:hypothetical protein
MLEDEKRAASLARRARMQAGERMGCGDETQPVGSEQNPLAVMQHGYFGCRHATRTPQPRVSEWYRVRVFVDSEGDCPRCRERKAASEAAP